MGTRFCPSNMLHEIQLVWINASQSRGKVTWVFNVALFSLFLQSFPTTTQKWTSILMCASLCSIPAKCIIFLHMKGLVLPPLPCNMFPWARMPILRLKGNGTHTPCSVNVSKKSMFFPCNLHVTCMFNKLTSVFFVSVLLLIVNVVITLSMKVAVDSQGDCWVDLQTTLTMSRWNSTGQIHEKLTSISFLLLITNCPLLLSDPSHKL